MKSIQRIVLTGGPCSGKSTFLNQCSAYYEAKGYRVLIDHEAATDLITGGISPATMTMYEFQKYVIALQLKKEELYMQAAKEIQGDKVLVFYDRAILDDKSYVGDADFVKILGTFGMKEESLTQRYDLVLHMTTAAKDSPEAYTLLNNGARYETAQIAVEVDQATFDSWKVHPNHILIPGEQHFEDKIRHAFSQIDHYLEALIYE